MGFILEMLGHIVGFTLMVLAGVFIVLFVLASISIPIMIFACLIKYFFFV